MTMIRKVLQLGRRQLHTIVTRETIKPSAPTPSHLRTYNFSPLDQLSAHGYIPFLVFYPNNPNCTLTAHDKATVLKQSLSQSLTRYYPFAGTLHTPTTPYVDCNDQGVVFLEAKHDTKLQMSIEQDDSFYQLFPNNMVGLNSPSNTSLIGVQLNHFACGGVGLAVSMSHLIGDGSTLGFFLNHWASIAQYGSPDHINVLSSNPHIVNSPRTNNVQAKPPSQGTNNHHVTRRFVFPNSKLNDLKNKVITDKVKNPTRFEALVSLLYTTAMATTTANYGCFKPSSILMPVNIREKFVRNLPQSTLGNCVSFMAVTTRDASETSLSAVAAEIRKNKGQLERIRSLQDAVENGISALSKLGDFSHAYQRKHSYVCSNLCGIPYNKVDFGWGRPIGTSLAYSERGTNIFFLMDARDGDGIEALVFLDKKDMEIFENDKEMLSFCQINQI